MEKIWNNQVKGIPTATVNMFDGVMATIYDDSWCGTLFPEEIEFWHAQSVGKRTLEIGSGTGRVSLPLLKRGIDLYGIDGSSSMLTELKKKLNPTDQDRFLLWDAMKPPFPVDVGTFDCIIIPFSTFTSMHDGTMSNFDNRLMKECFRILRQEGTLIINDWFAQPTKHRTKPYFVLLTLANNHTGVFHVRLQQCPNYLFPEQVIRERHTIIFHADTLKIREEYTEEVPLWDVTHFPLLGEDAGFLYQKKEFCTFHVKPGNPQEKHEAVNYFFKKL